MVSKIGKMPITIPAGVNVQITDGAVSVKGPKGELSISIPLGVSAKKEAETLNISLDKDAKTSAFQGLVRTLLSNAVFGVTTGWTKTLELVGTGYRVAPEGANLTLSLGYSHPIKVSAVPGITFAVDQNKIIVSGADKDQVGLIAAKIRDLRPPEPYKGKGVKYLDEKIRRKAGKAAKAVGGIGAK